MIEIKEQQLLEPFRTHWFNEKTNYPGITRNYKFYLLDKEIYILDCSLKEVFPIHWSDQYGGKQTTDKPHIICLCGNTTFTLRYGDYEIRARCSNCNVESVVYDG